MEPEQKVKKKVRETMKQYGADVWYCTPIGSAYGKPALDFIGFAFGHGFAVETKRPPGPRGPGVKQEPTDRQRKTIIDIARAGGTTFVVYDDTTLEKFALWLEGLVDGEGP